MKLVVAGLSWLCAGAAVQAASFPCTGVLTPVERLVYQVPALSVLDEHLGRYHAAAHEAAAPRVRDLPPLEARGRWASEVAGGDGYVVQSPTGRKHPLVASMFIDESNEMLATLAAQTGATYVVRGHLEPGQDAATHFAQSRCRYVYR